MTRNVRTYSHFCLTARALEIVGDRWTLLVVRDLLSGAKRFTDLMDRLGGITPKTLTQRLGELAETGLVTVDRKPGRREVWYELTPAGADLGPVIDALGSWGGRHAFRIPEPDEPVHAEHLLRAAIRAIGSEADDHESARWHFRLDGGDYLTESDGHQWTLAARAPSAPADVTVTGTARSLIAFIFAGADAGLDIDGAAAPVERFRRLIRTMAAIAPSSDQS